MPTAIAHAPPFTVPGSSTNTALVEMGILGDTVANRGLLNVTGLQRLHNGAIWQLYSSLKDQEEEIKSLKEQLVALTAWKKE